MNETIKRNKLIKHWGMRIALLVADLLCVTAGMASPAAAQTETAGWSTPINLSKSGATANAVMAIDAQGAIHVFWDDEISGGLYTQGDGMNWSDPIQVDTPFTGFPAGLYADGLGNIHAFWIGEEGVLYYSQISADGIGASDWESPQSLSENALSYVVEVDDKDQLHLMYVRPLSTAEFPAGVYYRNSDSGGTGWSSATVLYDSPYYRTMEPESAHLDLASAVIGETVHMYASWDNPPQARVFLAHSEDGGITWSEPFEVDKPDAVSGSLSPSHLIVHASGEEVLLVWDSGDPDTGCTSYYQWSFDSGASWQSRQPLSEALFGCPEDIQILEKGGEPLLFVLAAQPYMQIWDGSRWSDPQVQTPLMSFIDGETQKVVELDCQQASLVSDVDLFMLGCDSSDNPDVWWMQRPVGDLSSWFPPAPVWSRLSSIASGGLIVSDPVIVPDGDNLVHAVWVESPESLGSDEATSILYARWEGENQWSVPETIASLLGSIARDLAAVIDSAGNLLLVWVDGSTGAINFSQVEASRAVIAEDWSEPVPIPIPQGVGSSPNIALDGNNKIYVTYAVPINLGRGIFLTTSEDSGLTWAEPVRVFDAEAADWAMVDKPQIALSGGNKLHILWYRFSPPSGTGPLGLFYAQSVDGGLSWSAPETLVEKPIEWSQIGSQGDRLVHRMWREESSGSITIWHDLSTDNGSTWSRSAPVSVFGSLDSLATMASDSAERVHLIHLVNRGAGNYTMQHWVWGSEGWITEQGLDISQPSTTRLTELAATITNRGDLVVLINGITLNTDTGKQEDSMLFTRRVLNLEGLSPVNPIVPTPVPSATPTVAPTPTTTPDEITTRVPVPGTAQTTPERRPGNFPDEPTGGGSSMWWYAAGFVAFLAVGLGAWYWNKTR